MGKKSPFSWILAYIKALYKKKLENFIITFPLSIIDVRTPESFDEMSFFSVKRVYRDSLTKKVGD
jgi:hypothetical protein